MSQSDYLIAFYNIVVGLTVTIYLQGWGDLIKDRKINKNYVVTLIWTLSFLCAIINEWLIQYNNWDEKFSILHMLNSMIFPFCLYIIGVLSFPHEKGSELEEDYFTHFLSQKKIIMGVLAGLLLLKFDLFNWEDGGPSITTRIQVSLLMIPTVASFISDRKRVLMVSGILYLIFWISYILNWWSYLYG